MEKFAIFHSNKVVKHIWYPCYHLVDKTGSLFILRTNKGLLGLINVPLNVRQNAYLSYYITVDEISILQAKSNYALSKNNYMIFLHLQGDRLPRHSAKQHSR